MRLNESQKRAIYSDIMNDVARIVKTRVNESVSGDTLCFDIEVSESNTRNIDFKSNSTFTISIGCSNIDEKAFIFATFYYIIKTMNKKYSDMSIIIK